jgi:pyridoxal phosphate enzyme (YggS family)
MAYGFVAESLVRVRDRIEKAAKRSGRDPSEVEILAVTKNHPIEAAEAALAAGILRAFAESRVQEARAKYPDFLAAYPGLRFDLIGSLQSNKVKKAVELFDRIQSVDSLELLLDIDKKAALVDRRVEVLFELHTGEESKAGFRSLDELCRALDTYLRIENPYVVPRGLMTMAPNTDDQRPVRTSFRSLYAARDLVRSRFDLPLFDQLSMGMSGDFEIAVEEGSSSVRLGTILFTEAHT